MTRNSIFHSVIGNGYHGVAVFFVISGYLITTLLLREFGKTKTVSLKHFYFRRTMRIFPTVLFFFGDNGRSLGGPHCVLKIYKVYSIVDLYMGILSEGSWLLYYSYMVVEY